MSTAALWTTGLSVLLSTLLFLLLALSDDKRHRSSDTKLQLKSALRKALAWASILPALVLTYYGFYTGLLIWIGAITITGWALAAVSEQRL